MQLTGRVRLCLAVICCSCAPLLFAVDAGAVSFGISDAPSGCAFWGSNTCTSWSYGFASYSGGPARAAFTLLRQNLPLRYVRVFVPYDAVWDANPSTQSCRWSSDYTTHSSPQYPHGGGPGSSWFRLAQDLADARAVGLTPLVVLTHATSAGQQHDGNPATPDPTAASSAGPAAVTTPAGQDYSCGVQGLISLVHSQGLPVGEWEAWNEPDGSRAYNGALTGACGSLPNNCGGVYDAATGLCGSTAYTQCGPLEAAELYAELETALLQAYTRYGWTIPPVGAGTPSWPSTAYFNAYLNQLTTVAGRWPQYIAFHDYADVTSDGHAQSLAFTKDVYKRYAAAGKPPPSMWITESGTVLTDRDRSYNGVPVSCTSGEADESSTLGACVDGNPTAQQADATDFLNLASTGAYSPGQITELFWYQFQPANASTGWDSGLLAPPQAPVATWAQVAPDGVYGSNLSASGLRASFCVLARISSTSCSSAPVEASDWSIQPRTVTALLTRGAVNVTSVVGDQTLLQNGDFVTGPGIPPGTVITSGAGTSSWALSNPATTGGSVSLTASG